MGADRRDDEPHAGGPVVITLRVLLSRLRGLIGVRTRDRELREEIEAHLDLLTREHMEHGMPEADARAAARRAFGGIETVREAYRDQSRLAWASSFAQDVRFGVRLLARDRRFTFGAVIALALGISVNNMMFTFVNAVMFRDLPLEKPQQLVGSIRATRAAGRSACRTRTSTTGWRHPIRSVSSPQGPAGK